VAITPEQAALGETSVGGGLRVNDAMVTAAIPASDVRLIDRGGMVANLKTLDQLVDRDPGPFDAAVLDLPQRNAVEEAAEAMAKVVKVAPVRLGLLDDGDAATARLKVAARTIAVHADVKPKTLKEVVVHEYAHFLDNFMASSVPDDTDVYGSEEGSDSNPLRDALLASAPVKAIRADEVAVLKGDHFGKAQMTQGRELFARAFEQFIAKRSGDPDLLRNLESVRGDEYLGFQFWSDKDFAPIETAMEAFLRERGLLRETA
jgi:hypothetical protein